MPLIPTKWRVLKQSKIEKAAKPGTIVYGCIEPGYGVAKLDARVSGIPHGTFTLDPVGGYPFFTMPLPDVEKIESKIGAKTNSSKE